MKLSHRLASAPNSLDTKTKYRARWDVKVVGSKFTVVWSIYTPKTRKKKTKTVSKQAGKGG